MSNRTTNKMNNIKNASTDSNTGAVKTTSNKKSNFRILTKEQVEADRSKAYSYVR